MFYRAIKLLDLLAVGLNGRADERAFAKAIRMGCSIIAFEPMNAG